MGVVGPVEMSDTEQSDIGLETQHGSAATGLLQQHRVPRAKARLRKEARKPQFYSPLSRNRR